MRLFKLDRLSPPCRCRLPRRQAVAFLLLSLVGAAHQAFADDIDAIQRRDLALIQTQLEQIRVVVDRINDRQFNAQPGETRIYFNVPRFRADIDTLSHGIDAYLAPDRLQPRHLSPLEGDYLEDRGTGDRD